MFRFEGLEIWQRSKVFAETVYKVTESFPAKEQFGLSAQARRSVISVAANIAEGSSRASDKDFSRFLEIAYGSLSETVSHLIAAQSVGFISPDDLRPLYDTAEASARMLTAFRSRLGEWR